jgi:hypothetical protein
LQAAGEVQTKQGETMSDPNVVEVREFCDEWHVCGGGLPAPYCWSKHDTREEAEAEAAELRADLGI